MQAKISEILEHEQTFSFEFFPPKTPEAETQLAGALRDLEPLKPSFVSVTYGAGGTTRERTHDLVVSILRDTAMLPMAHLTCAAHTLDDLVEIVTRYRDEGVRNILALRGDPPADVDVPSGELDFATDLVGLVRDIGDFAIGVAVHPEGHPASRGRAEDRRRQAEKLALADFGVSQLFFEAEVWSTFVEEMRSLGVVAPLIPGIMPVTNVKSVKRMAAMSGADFPAWLEARLRAVEDDPAAMHRVGVEAATDLCRRLLDDGVAGLHFYTLNRSSATREIHANLGLGARRR